MASVECFCSASHFIDSTAVADLVRDRTIDRELRLIARLLAADGGACVSDDRHHWLAFSVDLDDLADITGTPVDGVIDRVRELMDRGILRVNPSKDRLRALSLGH